MPRTTLDAPPPTATAAHGRAQARARERRRTRLRVLAAAVVVVVLAVLAIALTLGRDGGTGPAGPPTEQGAAGQQVLQRELTWAPPELTNPTTIEVSEANRSIGLEPDRDYVIQMPEEPLDVPGGLVIGGGRNVVLIGGEIHISAEADSGVGKRGLFLKNQTGTVHVEGLLITGPTLAEGINLDQREGAVVQLQNIRVERVRGEKAGHHADVLQTWAGPSELRIDGLTGHTTYQGFFLLPQQFGEQDEPELFDLRNINIVGDDAGYFLWRDDADWPVELRDVWVTQDGVDLDDVDRDQFLWARGDDSADTWQDVELGVPPDGDFVPRGAVGTTYVSPGYVDQPADR